MLASIVIFVLPVVPVRVFFLYYADDLSDGEAEVIIMLRQIFIDSFNSKRRFAHGGRYVVGK